MKHEDGGEREVEGRDEGCGRGQAIGFVNFPDLIMALLRWGVEARAARVLSSPSAACPL